MNFVDSHCHLPFLKEKEKLEKILERAYNSDVTRFVNIGTSLDDNTRVLEVSRKYSSVFATASVYPHEDKNKNLNQVKECLEKFLSTNHSELVGIGETGIDITNWEGGRSIEKQVELFEFHINLAKKYKLPLVIHNRNADSEIIQLLTKLKPKNGVIHCFSSEWDFAESILDLGFYVSFSGFITYKSRKYLLETVKKVPTDRFLIETDSPYISPTGHRGQRNEPKYVRIVAQMVAETKGLSLEQVAAFSTSNANNLFQLNTE